MSHPQQLEFISNVKQLLPSFFHNQKVLEIGSLNINGSIRQFFENCSYIGLDVGAGRDVDVIGKGEEYDAPDGTFDVTVSCECFEHNPQWVETFRNMIRMTKSNGLVLMTCATAGRPEHGTARTSPADSPLTISLGWNYYRNLVAEDFKENFNFDELFVKYEFIHNITNHDLYMYALKR